LQHDGFVDFVEIAGGFVARISFGSLINARAIATRCCSPRRAAPEDGSDDRQADSLQCVAGLLLVRYAVKILREHNVFDGSQIGDQMKLLETKPTFSAR